MSPAYVGTAGWTVPHSCKGRCPGEDSHLHRYARVLNCAEINSSFHREHMPQTYERWAAGVPDDFRFSAKLSKYFTQEKRLKETGSALKDTLAGIAALGNKWAVLLVQLPPKLEFNPRDAAKFISKLKNYVPQIKIAWEPRHESWGSAEALALLSEYGISKVLADPERCAIATSARPPVEAKLRYFRLHGSPVIYRSSYPRAALIRLAGKIAQPDSPTEETWVVFDNTTLGHGTENALDLREIITAK
jgi:uncharacterized protein YecE (DUF72 family)